MNASVTLRRCFCSFSAAAASPPPPLHPPSTKKKNASVTLRRCFCSFSAAAASPPPLHPPSTKKKPLVFLGSPQVSTKVLDALFTASESSNSIFEVAAVVTQPPSTRDRGRKLMPSPVAQYALDRGFPVDLIFTPERASEVNLID
ncbi:hypothetical protein Dimus_023209 [Dionaea muscipula]